MDLGYVKQRNRKWKKYSKKLAYMVWTLDSWRNWLSVKEGAAAAAAAASFPLPRPFFFSCI